MPKDPYWKYFCKEILPFILSPILFIGLIAMIVFNNSVGHLPQEEYIIPKLIRRPVPERPPDVRFVVFYINCDEYE